MMRRDQTAHIFAAADKWRLARLTLESFNSVRRRHSVRCVGRPKSVSIISFLFRFDSMILCAGQPPGVCSSHHGDGALTHDDGDAHFENGRNEFATPDLRVCQPNMIAPRYECFVGIWMELGVVFMVRKRRVSVSRMGVQRHGVKGA